MDLRFAAVVLAVLATASEINGVDYCTICADHTMCKYPGVGPACKPRISGGVPTPAEQAIILDAHNAARSKVAMGTETRGAPGPQPAAANMAKLVWNSEIATMAQRWANQCTFAHDTCRKDASKASVGQNIFIIMTTATTTTIDWASAVTAWVGEVSMFNKSDVNPYKFTSGTGHYTQAVWATTTSVGCGRAVFKDADPTWTKQIYVCNYAPTGNLFINGVGTMYIAGTPCSQCPVGMKTCSTTSATNKGLCSA